MVVNPGSNVDDEVAEGALLAGRYRVLRAFGRGSLGSVYLCRCRWNDALVAVKLLHPQFANVPGAAARFVHHARALAQLDHPNIVSISEWGEDAALESLYLASEFVEGRDLSRLLVEDWPLSDLRVVDVMSQLLDALGHAHSCGVMHGDLKPSQILLRMNGDPDAPQDRVVVCDLGLAQLANATAADVGEPAGLQRIAGMASAEYTAPELLHAETWDERSDIYAAGVVLFQLLTRTLPFVADDPLELGRQHRGSTPPPPSGFGPVNPALESACLKALSKTREARFQTANEMRDALEAAVQPRSSAREPRWMRTSWRPSDGYAGRASLTPQPRERERTKPAVPLEAVARPVEHMAFRASSFAPTRRSEPRYVVPKRPVAAWLFSSVALASVGISGALNYGELAPKVSQFYERHMVPLAQLDRADARLQRASRALAVSRETVTHAISSATSYARAAAASLAPVVSAAPAEPASSLNVAPDSPAASAPAAGEPTTIADSAASASSLSTSATSSESTPDVSASPQTTIVSLPTSAGVAPGASTPIDAAFPSAVEPTAPALDSSPAVPSHDAAQSDQTPIAAAGSEPPRAPPLTAAATKPFAFGEPPASQPRVVIGVTFKPAGVSPVSMREIVENVRLVDCYKAVRVLGTCPRQAFDARLDLETRGSHVTFASLRGANVSSDLERCIEHVARTSHVQRPASSKLVLSATLTFQPPP